jgi:prepilin-type N-terminal cleavage/methylation domain-containing protein
MKHRITAGFTLIEMLMALALTAIVATAALVALDTFVDADREATQRMEENVGVGRALQQLRRDVADATALDIRADRWVVTRRDGTAIAYTVAVGGTELHRLEGTDAANAAAKADADLAAVMTAPTYSARGHLRDTDYRAHAVLQGVRSIVGTAVVQSGSTLGVNVTVQHGRGESTQCLAMSIPLMETQKAVAAAGAAGTGSGTGSGSGSGSGGLLDGLGDLLKLK